MANKQIDVYELKGLSSGRFLGLMDEWLTNQPGNQQAAHLIRVQFLPDGVVVLAPILNRGGDKDRIDALLEIYRSFSNTPPSESEMQEKSGTTLVKALAIALLRTASKETGSSPLQDESLVLLNDLNRDSEAEVVAQRVKSIARGATKATIASASDQAGNYRWICRAKTDESRLELFTPLPDKGTVLNCYDIRLRGDTYKIYLEVENDRNRLNYGALQHFANIVVQAPALFGFPALLERESAADIPLIAIANSEIAYYLGLLEFLTAEELLVRQQKIDVDFVSLDNSEEALTMIKQSLKSVEAGYRLQLVPTQLRDNMANDQEIIEARIAYLKEALYGLQSISRPRPEIVRFTSDQLIVMVDILKHLPDKELREGRIRYAFQASSMYPRGLHYLYLEPKLTSAAQIVISSWSSIADPPMHFWLDPYWSGHYFHGEQYPMIFVPAGHVLHPTIHSWEPAEMDDYILSMIERWYRQSTESNPDKKQLVTSDNETKRIRAIKHPAYLFENTYRSLDLRISAIDTDRFAPLKTKISWLNDNLIFLEELEIEDFIHDLAQESVRRQLLENSTHKTKQTLQSYTQAEDRLKEQLIEKSTSFSTEMTDELDKLLDNLTAIMKKISTQRERISKLQTWESEMRVTSDQLEKLIQTVENKQSETGVVMAAQMKEALNTIQKTESQRSSVQGDIEALITRLKTTENNLIVLLNGLEYRRRRTRNNRGR